MSRPRREQIQKRDVLLLAGVLIAVLSVLAGAAWLLDRPTAEETAASGVGMRFSGTAEETVTFKGKVYQRKQNLKTYLIMGVDKDGPAKKGKNRTGGQADVQLLLVIDEANQTRQLLQINRDSIVDVPVLGATGSVINTQREQIALAHAYGNGTENSCRNAVRAVSGMLGNQPIDGYVALNMGGIRILNDFVGGVTVTIESDFSDVDPTLVKGSTITLNGDQAYHFIRFRRGVDDQTNLSRMVRHRAYLAGFSEKIQNLSQNDIIRCYDAVFDYLVTDMGSQSLVDLQETAKGCTDLGILTIKGKSYIDSKGVNAYELDESSLEQTIITLFYELKN